MTNSIPLNETEDSCLIPDHLLMIVYGIGLVITFVVIIVSIIQGLLDKASLAFIFTYILFSGLVVFRKISITECPSKVLLIATAYILLVGIFAF